MKNYENRFSELTLLGMQIPIKKQGSGFPDLVDQEKFQEWFSSALNLIEIVFGASSTFSQRFRDNLEKREKRYATTTVLESGRGIFSSASNEYKGGYLEGLRREISEEFVIDLCLHAESLAGDGHLESAAVLTSAALEDCFKRRVEDLGVITDDKTLTDYIGILKKEGVLSGDSAKIVSGFPKFRNAAMHADWAKINEPEIRTIAAFIKNFAINHTS
jgi:hypothetical protein